MGRNPKQGFDYFPWDVDGINEIHIDMCMDEFGSDAYTMFHFILSAIYRDKGYFVIRDRAFDFAAARKLRVSRERINAVMDSLEENGLITTIEYDGKPYITSHGIQVQFLRMRKDCNRTGEFEMIPEIWLVNEFTGISSEKILKKEIKYTKQNKTKVKKSKEKQSTEYNAESSDDFQSFFSESEDLIFNLEMAGIKVDKGSRQWIGSAFREYDKRSISEAFATALEKAKSGEVRNAVGYARVTLERWAEGNGSPKWIEVEEKAIAAEKDKQLKPGAITKELMERRKDIGL